VTSAATATALLERLAALAADQVARDRWTREQLLAHQRSRLRALIAHATSASDYYRETLGPGAVDKPLSELPTLTKATLMEQWDRIVCDRRLRLAAVQEHVAGPTATDPYLGEFHVFSTSGASGLRGLFVYDLRDWETSAAVALRAAARGGAAPETRIATVGAPDGVHSSRRVYEVVRGARGDAPNLSVLTPLDEIVEALNDYQPEALYGYSSMGALLADEQLRGCLDIAPRLLAFGSEPLTEAMRERIRAAWGSDPAEYYVSTEAFVIACSTTAHPRTLDVFEDMVIVEVVDEHDRPVAPGTAGAKVLITNLENSTQPLIRYELSDRVVMGSGPSPSGGPYAHVTHIEGRAADVLVFPGAAGGRVAVQPLELGAPFARLPEVRQFQIVRDPDRLQVRVMLDPGAAAGTAQRIRAVVADTLAGAGAVVPAIEVTTVAELEREPGPAAKLKLIVAR
jgi:phenylacetate-coenzyme A ligase PaaK-like adenylate-forming protein